MKKIPRTSELLWLFGIIFVALGVAICSKANLGVSMIAAPTFVVQEAVVRLWSGFSVGVVEYLPFAFFNYLMPLFFLVYFFIVGGKRFPAQGKA